MELSSTSIPQSLAAGPDGNAWVTAAAYEFAGLDR